MAASTHLLREAPAGAAEPGAVLEHFLAWVQGQGLTLYPHQEDALLEVSAGRHVVLNTPTGSGKSLVALALHWKALCEARRSFYTAPIKALVSEKFFQLCETFGHRKIGLLTGDASINPGAPIICCTQEVLANMAEQQGAACEIGAVVMDEFHYYSDPERGHAWQTPLLTLPDTVFLLMSATLGNTASIEAALGDFSGREVAHVWSSERPVPLDFDYRGTPLHETVEALLDEDRAPVYVLNFTQRDAASTAAALTSAHICSKAHRLEIREALEGFRFDSPYGKEMRRLLSHGVGLHHAGLLPKYRLLVEQLSGKGLLRVICGTDTLGVGVNIPIRSVLFTSLAKYDGERDRILTVREFHQIAGRAGRKGFDERGSVICQAPADAIEKMRRKQKTKRELRAGRARHRQRRQAGRGAAGGGGGPFGRRRTALSWNERTFHKLVRSQPEALVSRFRITHGMLVRFLQRDPEICGSRGGYGALAALIGRCHESPQRKKKLLREAAVLFRALRRAGIIRVAGGRVEVEETLQADFSLHHTLSLYLVEALGSLDPGDEEHALRVVSCVEAVLEDPAALLRRQLDKLRDALLRELSARGVPFGARMAKARRLERPKPEAEFLERTFDIFAEHHPWVAGEYVRPKSLAREMMEGWQGFGDYVRALGIQRQEGLLLRYLGQVLTTLEQTVPETLKNEELLERQAYLRDLVRRTDTSLLQEWERQGLPVEIKAEIGDGARGRARFQPPPRKLTPRALRARVRAELHALVRALARRDFEEAARCLRADPDSKAQPWDEARLKAAMEPYFAEHKALRFDEGARDARRTMLQEGADGVWHFQQGLVDPDDQDTWYLGGEVVLQEDDPEGPCLRLVEIGT